MNVSKRIRRVLLAASLGLVAVHYLEEPMVPIVEPLRAAVLGEQSYTSALSGCRNATAANDWVHPSTLALTVYGSAVTILEARFGSHSPEVLPVYAADTHAEEELRCVAGYLYKHSRVWDHDGRSVRSFPFQVAEPAYGLSPGWVSGLTQGFAGQVFLAVALLDGDEQMREAAVEAARLLQIPVGQGGVLVIPAPYQMWFAEYASVDRAPPRVLNGHLLALDFLYWMSQAFPDDEWRKMFEAGVRSAVENIAAFNGLVWSYYDAEGRLANQKYHRFHIRQLQRYGQHDPTGRLAEAASTMRWQAAVPLGIVQRIATQPTRLIIFLAALFGGCIYLVLIAADIWRSRRNT